MAERVVRIDRLPATEVAPNPLPLERGTLDWVQGVVHRGDGRVHLGEVERRLLRALVRALGQPVPTDTLLDAGWPGQAPSDGGLSVAMRRLRCKIEVDPAHPVHLRNVRGTGYLLRGAGETPAVETGAAPIVVRLTDGAIDLTAGVVHREGRSTPLTATELALLRVLEERPVADREMLLARVLGYRSSSRSRALDAVVARLRKKIEPDPGRPVHLVTVRGRGLQLVPAPPRAGWPLGWGRGLVGRDADLHALRRRIAGGVRLLTVTGPAGVGKSRLAREVAERMFGAGGGLLAVDLAESGLEPAVAEALGVAGAGDPVATAERIGLALASRGPALLVLDNADPVVSAARIVGRWLEGAPELQVLVTSRERLGLAGEALHELGPLSPADAHRLYVDRARELFPDLSLDADADRRLCATLQELDHLPLAIELMAGWADVHGLDAPAVADGEGRHRSLDAAIGWSWDRLDPTLRSALVQCTVFRAAFDAEAAAAVLDAPEGLPRLVRSHLLGTVRGKDGGTRFQLLGTIRRFVEGRELGGAVERHRGWALGLARRDLAESMVAGPGPPDPWRWAELLAVLDGAVGLEERVDAVIGLRQHFEHHDLDGLGRALAAVAPDLPRLDPERQACLAILELHLVSARGQPTPAEIGGIVALADAVDRTSHPRVGAGLRFVLANALAAEGRLAEAEDVAGELVASAEPRHRGWGELVLGTTAFVAGALGAARPHLERAGALFGAHGTAVEASVAQSGLSLVYREEGRLGDARAALEQALASMPSGPHADRARGNVGLLALVCQAPREALGPLTASLEGARRRGAWADTLVPHAGLAIAWLDLGDRRRVEEHLAAVESQPMPPGMAAECALIRGLAAWDDGDSRSARAHLAAARAEPVHPTATAEAEVATAWVLLAEGEAAGAAEAARPAVERVARSGARLVEVHARATLAIALAGCGELAEARQVLEPVARFSAEPCRATLLVEVAAARIAGDVREVTAGLRASAGRSVVARMLRRALEP